MTQIQRDVYEFEQKEHYRFEQKEHYRFLQDKGRVRPYSSYVLDLSPDAYWPMFEDGGNEAIAEAGTGINGAYVGAVLGGMVGPTKEPTPFFDGVNDVCDLYSTNLDALLDRDTWSLSMLVKAGHKSVWTDGTARTAIHINFNATNYIKIARIATNNIMQFLVSGSGTLKASNATGKDTAQWFQVGIVHNRPGDSLSYFWQGDSFASHTGLGIIGGGGLTAGQTVVGANNNSASSSWLGSVAHVAWWNSLLSVDDMAYLVP